MKRFGLPGGIGVPQPPGSKLPIGLGVSVVDTDLNARQVVEPGQPALQELKGAFGEGIVARDGALKRHELAKVVFADPAARAQLEAILHPRIRAVWLAQVETWKAEQRRLGVVVVPLLFETNAGAHFDATICVACSRATQHERLQVRGWNAEQIEQRRQAQWPVEKKMSLSDYVVWTEGGLALHKEQLRRIIQRGG